MRPGDLVRPKNLNGTTAQLANILYVNEKPEPTFSSRGASRIWPREQVAIVVDKHDRKVGASYVTKVQVMLEGHLWWVTEYSIEVIDEAG
jgi:hypothetical protein